MLVRYCTAKMIELLFIILMVWSACRIFQMYLPFWTELRQYVHSFLHNPISPVMRFILNNSNTGLVSGLIEICSLFCFISWTCVVGMHLCFRECKYMCMCVCWCVCVSVFMVCFLELWAGHGCETCLFGQPFSTLFYWAV